MKEASRRSDSGRRSPCALLTIAQKVSREKLPIAVKLSDWQLIFLQSRANGCFCNVENLPHVNWQWPQNTWFQARLSHYLHVLEASLELGSDQRSLRRAPSHGRAARPEVDPASPDSPGCRNPEPVSRACRVRRTVPRSKIVQY
jgi:hypothetical protein